MQKWPVVKKEDIKQSQEFQVPFMLELDDENKIFIKKLLAIKEICSWLHPRLNGRKVCSQKLISLTTNSSLFFFSTPNL